jgi:hypothetical protein
MFHFSLKFLEILKILFITGFLSQLQSSSFSPFFPPSLESADQQMPIFQSMGHDMLSMNVSSNDTFSINLVFRIQGSGLNISLT